MNGGFRTKALPSRPSQDNGYINEGRQVNGYSQEPNYNAGGKPRGGVQDPNGRAILDGYRQDIITGFELEKPRYNPMNAARPQSSTLLNVNDEIQVHLLVETALGDSKEYEILSQEEVDDLKRQVQSLTARIDQTRQNLAIQSKYRDAAINMSRLYSQSSRTSADTADGKKRRSLLGHNRTPSHEVREAEQERQASERRCEELASELWTLEKRLIVPQSRLLKHTAGILQLTHKGPATPRSRKATQDGAMNGGIPGSPESMYTYDNARSSVGLVSEEDLFDERSLYKSADAFWDETSKDARQQGLSKEQSQMIAATEQKVVDLNSRLKAILVKANPQRELPNLPVIADHGDPVEALRVHLESMEKNLFTIDTEHSELLRGQQESDTAIGNMEQTESVMMGLWDIIKSGEQEERQRKRERRQTRSVQNLADDDDSPDEDDDMDEVFSMQAFSSKVQWLSSQATKLKDQKKVLQRQIKQQRELNSKSDATKDAELAGKSEELARTNDLLTRSERDADSVREQLSLMMEKLDESQQQERLREQTRSNDESSAVKQVQGELNQRIQLTAKLEEELQDLKDDLAIAEAEMAAKIADSESRAGGLEKELALAVAAKTALDSSMRERDEVHKRTESRIEELQQAVSQREGDLRLKEQTIQAKDKELQAIGQNLKLNDQASKGFENELKTATEKFEKASRELEDSNMEIARLTTEVTIARAELEGAYGTRAQRAAETTNPALEKEVENLQLKNFELAAELATLRERPPSSGGDEKMKILKKELEETIEEYEQMTKASIEWEKERESLEVEIDRLRDEREGLEAQLSDEKVRWLGMKSPGIEGAAGPGGNTSTTVLRNEFRKMMRDTRDGHTKMLRAEQEARKKAEDELRALKKQLGPGKSGLSQSFGLSSS